jgi:hypothetical protein
MLLDGTYASADGEVNIDGVDAVGIVEIPQKRSIYTKNSIPKLSLYMKIVYIPLCTFTC